VVAARSALGLRRRAVAYGRSTPGRMLLALVALVLLGLATGVAGVRGVGQRADLIDRVTARSGQLSVAAQSLYRALSDADATAAGGFLSNGLEPPALRDRYRADIADATRALAVISGGTAGVGAGGPAITRITAQLPVYTGLVETARAYNRQGLPLGVAYLQQASGLMRGTLLPAAQELYRAVADALDHARDRAAEFPWFAVPLGLCTAAALVWTQLFLTRRTNRVLNPGMLVATVAAVTLVGWLSVSAVTAAGHLRVSRDAGSAQVDRLAEARAAGLQARADEALTLVARGDGGDLEEDYAAMMRRLTGADGAGGLLAQSRAAARDAETRQALDAATARAADWLAAHRAVRRLDDNGEYGRAVAAAIGPGPETTASIFNAYDAALARAVAVNGDRFQREARAADDALVGVDVATGVLAGVLVVGATVGLRRRLGEYR
jgi:hypothetical protein